MPDSPDALAERAAVVQCDRDAAADYMAAVSAMQGRYDPVSMAFMDEACDDLPIVQALARHRAQTTAVVVAWMRRDVGMEATRMMLAAGIPGGTRTQRVKSAAFADGIAHAVTSIINGIERGAHLPGEAR